MTYFVDFILFATTVNQLIIYPEQLFDRREAQHSKASHTVIGQ